MASSIDDNKETARLIRKLRVAQNLSQQQLAERAGVSFSFVNQVEGGKQTVRLDALNKLLLFFGYTMAPQKTVQTEPLSNIAIELAAITATQTTIQTAAQSGNQPASPPLISALAEEATPPLVRQKNDWAFFQ